jgi:diaminohydroxyphosphoribosylaminopyrimidine deaminase/5-amino-6-(5-phosphoribosylamino)uracil reductase
MRVVLGRSGQIRPGLQVVRTAHAVPTTVIVDPDVASDVGAALEGTGVEVIGAPDLADAMRGLRARGILSVLVEGGGAIAGALLEAGLVDRLYWIQAPMWLGRGTPAFGRRTAVHLGDVRPWTVVERAALGVDTLLVVDKEPCLQE